MNQKKKIIIRIILLSLIILSIIISANPRFVDRALYRIGVQEQVCFSDPKIDQNQNEKNFVFVGDFGINRNSLNTLNNMKLVNPEMIILTGDLGQATFEEWKELSINLEDETVYTVLGDSESEIFNGEEYLKHYGLENEYYSFDYENIHFLGISTKLGNISYDFEQLEFIKNDLERNYKNSETQWTIVFMHLPMYSSKAIDFEFMMEIRNELQPIFDSYQVDLVVSGHKHAYERTNSLMFNNVILGNEKCEYYNSDGQVYLTVGTGGHSHSAFDNRESWSIIQNDNDYGFFNLVLSKEQNILYGEFISNTGKIVDSFKIENNEL